jgi:hypothetical protein
LDLIDHLRTFNVKERFHLIRRALGIGEFKLGSAFRRQLGGELRLTVPEHHFAAIDYHLNWIYAALFLSSNQGAVEPYQNPITPDGSYIVQRNIQDIDLLVVFKGSKNYHLILIEAKGVTNWIDYELALKAKRLKGIFGDNGRTFTGVRPHFVLTSPGRPIGVSSNQWPKWMKGRGKPFNYVPLPIEGDLRKVTRTDSHGKPRDVDEAWRALPVGIPGLRR